MTMTRGGKKKRDVTLAMQLGVEITELELKLE